MKSMMDLKKIKSDLPLIALIALFGCGERSSSPSQVMSKETQGATTGNPSRSDARCNPAFTAEQCEIAIRSLERDAKQLGQEAAAQGQSAAAQKQQEDSQNRAMQDILSKECAEQRAAIDAMRRMQTPSAGERFTQEELDMLPAQIAKSEDYIDRNCR